jgi:hypothetical protein
MPRLATAADSVDGRSGFKPEASIIGETMI